jgi:hypothetical protein
MDLTAELAELSHGLHRQRRLIELTVNRLHLAALILEQRSELAHGVSLDEVHRVLEHLHHEEIFRAVLVAGIAAALGTGTRPDLIEIIAYAPPEAGNCLADRRDRLVRAINAADALSEQLHLDALKTIASPDLTMVHGGEGTVIELDAPLVAEDLVETARRVAQPSLRDFLCHPI